MELVSIDLIKVVEPSIKLPSRTLDGVLNHLVDTFGQLKPLIVDQDMVLIDGHSLFYSLKHYSFKEVWIKKVTTSNRKQLYLELNLSQKEIDAVECIRYLKEVDADHAALPWPPSKIGEMVRILDFDWDTYKKSRESETLF